MTTMSPKLIGYLIQWQALTAHLERIPNTKEINKIIPKKSQELIKNYLQSVDVSLTFVLRKVLEDVEFCSKKRAGSRVSSARFREKQQDGDMSRDNHGDGVDKIREDKRREDNPLPPVDLKYFHIANTGKTKTAVKNAVDRMDLSSQQKEEVIHDIGLIATSDFNADFISALQQCDNIVDRAISNSLEGFQFSKAFLEGR